MTTHLGHMNDGGESGRDCQSTVKANETVTREQLQKLAAETVQKHALHLVTVLRQGDYDGLNLIALLEIFAAKLDAAKSPDIVDVIDSRLGAGWTRKLAESLSALDVPK